MFNILDFGAVPNLEILQTRALQAAIDACEHAGGGRVTVPAGNYYISTLNLRNNVTLHLENNSFLLGSKNLNDYPNITDTFIDAVGHTRGKCLIYAKNIYNSSITGNGTIDGNGGAFELDENNRPFLIRYIDCNDVRLKNVNLLNSAAWVVHIIRSQNVQIHGVNIKSHANSNNDGIDVDSCNNVHITDCTIDTSDDAICIKSTDSKACENIKVYNCSLKSVWGALKIGTETYGDIRNVVFRDIKIRDTFGGGLKIISTDGSHLENILVDNIAMENVSGPIFIRLGSRLRTYYKNQVKRTPGILKNVVISNINIRVIEEGYLLYGKHPRKAGIIITGIPNHTVESVILDNLNVLFPGDSTFTTQTPYNVSEQEADYPEFPMFHPLPSWGFFLRHIKGITLKNINMKTEHTDKRPAIFIDDVQDTHFKDIKINQQLFDEQSQMIKYASQ
jgi:polygalacturonase